MATAQAPLDEAAFLIDAELGGLIRAHGWLTTPLEIHRGLIARASHQVGNGRQLADRVRERRPDLKVLFIARYADKLPSRTVSSCRACR